MKPVGDQPWMPSDAVNFFGDIVRNMQDEKSEGDLVKVLEFGSGGSTVWLDKAGCRVVTIEHNFKWHGRVRKQTTWHTFHIYHQRPYAGVCDLFPDELFDIVLVDGRDRLECGQAAMRLVARDGWMILDDANRHRYAQLHRDLNLEGWEKTKKVSTDATLDMVQNAPNKTRTTAFFRRPPHV